MPIDPNQWRDAADHAAEQASIAGRRVVDAAANAGSFLKQSADFVAAGTSSYVGRAFWATVVAIAASAFLVRYPLLSFPLGDILVVALGVPLAALVGLLAFRHFAPGQELSVRPAFVACAAGFGPSLVYDLLFLEGRASLAYVTLLLVVSWVIQVLFGTAALGFWQRRLAEVSTALTTPLEQDGESVSDMARARVAEFRARLRRS